YWFYGRTHSPLRDPAEQAAQSGLLKTGNFVTVAGALALFNGGSMTLLGLMTTLGITSEATAKWHEIGWHPDHAAVRGVIILVFGAVVFAVGRLLRKSRA